MLMTLSLLADALAIGLLMASPAWGGVVAGVLVVVYSMAAWNVHYLPSGSCGCFWRLLNAQSRESLVSRNLLLVVSAVMVTAAPEGLTVPAFVWATFLFAVVLATVRVADRQARGRVTVDVKE